MMIFNRIPIAQAPVHVVDIDGEPFYTAGGELVRLGSYRAKIAERDDVRQEAIVKQIMKGESCQRS